MPLSWCSPAAAKPKLLWTDVEVSGHPGGVWSVRTRTAPSALPRPCGCSHVSLQINSLGMMSASNGPNPPEGPFYDFSSQVMSSHSYPIVDIDQKIISQRFHVV